MIMSKKVFKQIQAKGLTIGFVESMTGGLLSHQFVKNKHASTCLKGSLVVYSNQMKTNILGIDQIDIEKFGVVSAEIAKQMALKTVPILKADIIVSVTGNSDYEYQEKGKLYFYYAIYKDAQIEVYQGILTNKSRIKNIRDAAHEIYQKIEEYLS